LKTALRVLVIGAVLLAAGAAHAQTVSGDSYPNHAVKVIVPFAPGGVTDVVARLWAQSLSQSMGQQIYVENQAGGASNLGMGAAARQPADGYAILVAASSFTINPGLYNKIPYDPVRDFAPVTLLATTPSVLVVHPSLPVKSLEELVALVRAGPGKYSYAMSGVGTPNHLQGEMFKRLFKLDLTTVPFAGGGPAIQSTLGGHTPIAFTAMTAVQSLVESGQLRALAVTGTRRFSGMPDVPTFAERGIKGQEAGTFTGILVPSGTPKEIVTKLHAETVKVLALPAVKQQLAKLGSEPIGEGPDEFSARIKDEIASWAKVIADVGIERQ